MSLSNLIRISMAMMLTVWLSACGFTPVYGPEKSATKLANNIEVEVQEGRYAFEFRERLQNRFGRAGEDARYQMSYNLMIEEEELVVNSDEEITRYNLTGSLKYLIKNRNTGQTVFEDGVTGIAAYSATAQTFPTRVAQQDANIRLVQSLAEQIATRLAITSEEWME